MMDRFSKEMAEKLSKQANKYEIQINTQKNEIVRLTLEVE